MVDHSVTEGSAKFRAACASRATTVPDPGVSHGQRRCLVGEYPPASWPGEAAAQGGEIPQPLSQSGDEHAAVPNLAAGAGGGCYPSCRVVYRTLGCGELCGISIAARTAGGILKCQCTANHGARKGHVCTHTATHAMVNKWWCLTCLRAVRPKAPPEEVRQSAKPVKRGRRRVPVGKPPVSSVGTLWAHDVTSKASKKPRRRRKRQA